MKQVWLIRHGESRAQTGEEVGLDAALSTRGEAQAARLRSRLADVWFDRVLVSPLTRARQTFESAAVRCGSALYDSRIIECSFGWSYAPHLPYAPPSGAEPDHHEVWLTDPVERARSVYEELVTLDAPRILLVGHWAIFNLILQWFLGNPAPREPVRGETHRSAVMYNCSISILGIDDERFGQCLLGWNDTRHVEDLLEASPHFSRVSPLGDVKTSGDPS